MLDFVIFSDRNACIRFIEHYSQYCFVYVSPKKIG